MQRMYQSRKNVAKATPNKTRCTGRMPQTSEFFVAVTPAGTVVKFILGDGSPAALLFFRLLTIPSRHFDQIEALR